MGTWRRASIVVALSAKVAAKAGRPANELSSTWAGGRCVDLSHGDLAVSASYGVPFMGVLMIRSWSLRVRVACVDLTLSKQKASRRQSLQSRGRPPRSDGYVKERRAHSVELHNVRQ